MSRRAMQMARDALENTFGKGKKGNAALAAIKAALRDLDAGPIGVMVCIDVQTDDDGSGYQVFGRITEVMPEDVEGVIFLADAESRTVRQFTDAGRPIKQLADEPAGQLSECYGWGQVVWNRKPADGAKLYISPQNRQPLTDSAISFIVIEAGRSAATRKDGTTSTRIARGVEAAHGIGKKT